jgi:hypothetical protein
MQMSKMNITTGCNELFEALFTEAELTQMDVPAMTQETSKRLRNGIMPSSVRVLLQRQDISDGLRRLIAKHKVLRTDEKPLRKGAFNVKKRYQYAYGTTAYALAFNGRESVKILILEMFGNYVDGRDVFSTKALEKPNVVIICEVFIKRVLATAVTRDVATIVKKSFMDPREGPKIENNFLALLSVVPREWAVIGRESVMKKERTFTMQVEMALNDFVRAIFYRCAPEINKYIKLDWYSPNEQDSYYKISQFLQDVGIKGVDRKAEDAREKAHRQIFEAIMIRDIKKVKIKVTE